MFQPNVAPWQQQQQAPHHQQQPPQQQQQQQVQQHHLQQHVQPQYPPQVDGKWNQHGINANAEQQMPFQPFGYNANNYVNYEQQPQQISQQGQQTLTQNFFDTNQNNNNNNNNNNGKSDEWGDWGDWNENNINIENNNQQKPQQQQQQQPALFNTQPQQQQQQQQSASNIINESFSTNDNHWNWNMNMNTAQPIATTTTPTPLTTTAATTNLTTSAVLPSPPAMQAQQQQVQRHISNFQQPPAQILDRTNESALQNITQENNAENVSAFTKPTTTAAATTNNNNIPNTVFVTQAKPVTMPSRQYASTPNEVSTVASNVEQIIPPPPEGFQNEAPKPPPPQQQQQQPGMPTVAPPPPMQAAGFALPPTTGMKSTVNPFKRAGAPQHHVANFITTQPPMPTERPTVPLVFEQPDNSEVLHENQEVVNQSYAAVPPQQQQQQIQKQQHLNDERNQYLQTSHLSENAIEENVEADSLPPPGLSRLVLGEPELEANQRQVTGTEDALPDLVGNMRLDERQADGEDNTTDSLLPASSAVVVDNMQIAADRNLYLVPGQSNGNNDQLPRVLTGLDNAVQIDTPTPTHSMQLQQNQQQQLAQQQQQQQQNQQQQQHINMPEQREIDLDGENIEDQQQQQQQRNEPPVEGAAAQIAPQIAVNMSLSEGKKSTQLNINKEESDIEQRRKHLNKKLSSMDRYNSDEESDDADYSSDKNRERKLNYRHKNDYREGSVRSEAERERERNRNRAWDRERERERDREENNSTMKQRTRRDKRDHESLEKEKPRDKYRSGMESGGTERRSKRYTRYDHDSSLEESNHKERSGRHKKSVKDHQRAREKDVRSDRGYEDANYRYRTSQREEKPRSKHEREEPVRRRGRDKLANRGGEYEDYSKRESDIEKERAQRYFDPRHAAMYGYPHGGQMTSPYDPYYYYDYMPRYNHPAYNEMMRKYYGTQPIVSTGDMSGVGAASSTAATGPGSDHLTGDGGESLHSGRSSLQQQHERYTHAYLTQANEYQRHYQQLQQQQQKQQNVTKHYSNMTYDDALYNNHYASGQQQMRAAHSTSNLSVTHSEISRSGLPLEGHAYYPNITLPTTMMANKYQQREASEYADSRFGEDSVRDAEVLPDPQRLTPCKFVNEHTVASLSAGVLVTVKPKYTTHGHSCNIVKVQRLGANDATHKLLQAFPGPLIRGQTHKKTIIEFCEEQIRQGPHHTTIFAKQLVNNDIETYRPSYTLMWNLLILLLRQNGMVVGTDIAELLLKNKNEFPYDIKQESVDTVSESEDSVEKENEQVEPQNHSEENGLSLSQSLNETEVTDKFRQYLLYGNVNEALDWAADNNLWGHALFLASKMDRRTHANVMMKFANKLSLNDPLQTLYQLMSGRTPSSVTSVQDEKWGDWRPHLSMILSNTSQKPELDRKAITTLGDSLFNRGDLYAAHFCYLMAQVGFGRYQESATHETTLQQHLPRLVLLGSSHYKSFRDFATNESIIMTEIYEYACSLNDDKFSLIEFQPYKYLYATRLLDYGHHLKTLMYMEQIALHIEKHANKYESSFINKVFELADRLKYYDPVVDKAVDDQHMEGVESPTNENSQEFEDQKWLQNLRSLTLRERENNSNFSAAESTSHQQYATNMIDEFVDINRQITELNNQYTGLNENPLQQQQQQPPIVEQQQPELYANNTQQMYAPTDISQQPDLNYQQQQTTQNAYYNPIQHQYDQQQPQLTDGGATQNPYDYWAQQPTQQQQHSYMPEESAEVVSLPKESPEPIRKINENQQQQQQHQQQQVKDNEYENMKKEINYNKFKTIVALNKNNNNNNNNNKTRKEIDVAETTPITTTKTKVQANTDVPLPTTTPFLTNENAVPSISLPKSKSYDTDDENQESCNQKQRSAPTQKQSKSNEANKEQTKQNKNNKENKSSQSATQNSGWFGGIWNKLSMKPKNQMILPDDKNPTIVWDAERKRWVNTDGDETAEESFKPPPKLGDMMMPPQQMQQQQQPQQSMQTLQQQPPPQTAVVNPIPSVAPTTAPLMQPSAAPTQPAPSKTPTLQSNMFKMQRNRTLKNSYVDVFNPSGAPISNPAENIMAPMLPATTVPTTGFFNPNESAIPATQEATNYQQQQQQQEYAPQFYNPNQFGGNTGPGY